MGKRKASWAEPESQGQRSCNLQGSENIVWMTISPSISPNELLNPPGMMETPLLSKFSPIAIHHPNGITRRRTKMIVSGRKSFQPPDYKFPYAFALAGVFISLDTPG
jgi:hypothetical protein